MPKGGWHPDLVKHQRERKTHIWLPQTPKSYPPPPPVMNLGIHSHSRFQTDRTDDMDLK